MSAVTDFVPFIVPFVHDCSDVAATVAARFALREFCAKSGWLQYEVDPITIQAGIAEYEIETPEETLCVSIVEAKTGTIGVDERDLPAKTQSELRQFWQDWRTQEGDPLYITQISRDYVRLVPSPTTKLVAGLRLLICLQPTLDCLEVDDALYQRYGEEIGFGARARLKEMAGQPYYDPAGAIPLRAQFNSAISMAKAERQRDFNRPVQRVQMRRW
jgi:hypothetical protein